MKKYISCFLLFSAAAALCLFLAFWADGRSLKEGAGRAESESVEEYVEADQMDVSHVPETGTYYLTAMDGMVVVLEQDRRTIALSTHMPLSDFPANERKKLAEGLWFSTILEIYSYLESCTS